MADRREPAPDVERVVHNPRVLGGKPTIRGTRISVAFILEALAGMTGDELLLDYPVLKRDDLNAALRYAARELEVR